MARISKNIRQYRTASGMTQNDLAGKMNVSRQTIASWETESTQPDVGMLEALASVFGVSTEEMIYGKRNKIGFEPEPKKDRNIMAIVLSVIGSLMTAAGLVIVFSYFWDKLENFKLVFAFMPLIAGFSFAVYTECKKKDSIPWTESAAVAWTVGLVVTNALANSMIDANFGYFILLLVDVLASMPVVAITKGIIPFMFCLYGASHSLIGLYCDEIFTSIFILSALLLAVSALGVLFSSTYPCNDIRRKIAGHAVAVTALTDLTTVICMLTTKINSDIEEIYVVLILLSGYALFAYNSHEKIPYFTPRTESGAYSALISVILMVLILDNQPYCKDWYTYLIPVGITVVLSVAGCVINRNNLKNDTLRILFTALSLVLDALFIVCMTGSEANNALTYATLIISLALALVTISKGVKTSDLFTANVGLVMACVIVWIVIIFSGFSTLAKGISCSLTGIVLLLADRKLVSSMKKEEAAEND